MNGMEDHHYQARGWRVVEGKSGKKAT